MLLFLLSSLPVCEVIESSCELVAEDVGEVVFEHFYGDVP